MSSTQLLNREQVQDPSVCERCCSFFGFGSRRRSSQLSIGSRQSMASPVVQELSSPAVKEGGSSSSRARLSKITSRSSMFSALSGSSALENLSVRDALEVLMIGCKTFEAQADNLPRGADSAVKALRARVEELQVLVERAEAWEKRCPHGGKLLWVQVSPAAGDEEPPEWALGNLFVTKECLFFEANESPPWAVGPVMWKDITRVEMLQGTKAQDVSQSTPCDVRLHYTGGNTSALRLQLSLVDVAWLERALPAGVDVVPLEAAPEVKEEQVEIAIAEKVSPLDGSFPTSFGIGQSMVGKLTPSFMAVARDMNKASADVARFKTREPLFTATFRDVSIDTISDWILQKDGFIENHAKAKYEAFDISSTSWGASQRFPGTFMSRMRWQMPAPGRLPEDVAKLVEIPDVLAVTLTSRLCLDDKQSELILMQRGCCQNMPYGETFMAESYYIFRFKDDESIVFHAYSDVIWSEESLSSRGVFKSFIESMSRHCALEVGKDFAQQFGGSADLSMVPEMSERSSDAADAASIGSPLLLSETLHLTGLFTKWSTNFEGGRLQPVPGGRPGFAKLKLCIRLTSESLTFAVVSGKRQWDWRLYPRDAVPIKIGFIKSHVSKEGMLTCGDPGAVVAALGNLSIGHGLNFHVLEKEGAVVTVWVEVPVTQNGDELLLNTTTAEGAHVWYTREDTGVHHVAGDGMDLSKYRKWLPPRS